jgi:hypothetical protein
VVFEEAGHTVLEVEVRREVLANRTDVAVLEAVVEPLVVGVVEALLLEGPFEIPIDLGEKEEIRQILRSKGLDGRTLEEAVSSISKNKTAWIDLMMSGEYGLSRTQRDPLLSAGSTFLAFVICGALPLLPFIVAVERPFLWASALTSAVFFLIGAGKSYWSLSSWWRSGLETLTIGTAAATMAFLVGYGLREFLGIDS